MTESGKVENIDDLIDVAGFYRIDGTIVKPEDEFCLGDIVMSPEEAYRFVTAKRQVHAWTMVSGDDGIEAFISGVSRVNAVGVAFSQRSPAEDVFDLVRPFDRVVVEYGEQVETEETEVADGIEFA